MPCVELSELNGAAGNHDYFAQSRRAEELVLANVARLIQKPITPTPGTGKHAYDFTTSKGIVGDVKIWSGSRIKVELTQVRRGVRIPGWYQEYQKITNFGGLLAVNHWHSNYHGQGVFKIRWVPWPAVQKGVRTAALRANQRGVWCELDPTHVDHFYIGDFMETASSYGNTHKAFDASSIHSNNKLNIQHLYTWF